MNYVIWSFAHRQWWRPNWGGYTPHLRAAGLYGPTEAGDIVTSSFLCESVAIPAPVAERMGRPTVLGLWGGEQVEDTP